MTRTTVRKIDLNSASEEELSRIAGVGRQRARTLIRYRPFKSIDEIKRIPGFNDRMLADLRRGGAMVGHRQGAASPNHNRRADNRRTLSGARPRQGHAKRLSRRTNRAQCRRTAPVAPASYPQPCFCPYLPQPRIRKRPCCFHSGQRGRCR